jgi:hypothetical protein
VGFPGNELSADRDDQAFRAGAEITGKEFTQVFMGPADQPGALRAFLNGVSAVAMKHPEWLQGLVDADGREVELSQSPSLRELGMSAYDGGHDRLPTRLRQTRMSHGSRRWATLAACFAASACAAVAAVTWLALGMVLGKVAWGWVSDRIGRPAVLVLLFAVAVAALLLMIGTASYAPLVLGMAAVASCYGGFVAVMGPVTADAFGARYLAVNFGIMFLSIAVAAVAGPQLGAVVAEASGGDYTVAFVVAAVISAAGLAAAAGYVVALRRTRSARAA